MLKLIAKEPVETMVKGHITKATIQHQCSLDAENAADG